MTLKSLLPVLALAMMAGAAQADPTGRFDVVGVNPDNGREYRGTVIVTRTGETYEVIWDIAGTRYRGTGLGALIEDGRFKVGPAHPDDTSISIGYVSDGSFGQAFYFQQDDGSWRGVWTYGGSKRVATENWFPK